MERRGHLTVRMRGAGNAPAKSHALFPRPLNALVGHIGGIKC